MCFDVFIAFDILIVLLILISIKHVKQYVCFFLTLFGQQQFQKSYNRQLSADIKMKLKLKLNLVVPVGRMPGLTKVILIF